MKSSLELHINANRFFFILEIRINLMNKNSGIRDNRKYGTVGDFISLNVTPNSKLAFVSAYFTIYAYQQLKNRLDKIDHLRFLFGEPRFLASMDPNKTDKKQFEIEDNKLVISLANRLVQSKTARDCAEWIREKVEIKSMVKPNFLHGKLYHITNENGVEKALLGSSNFTVNGLGYGNKPNIELNIEVADDRDRADLLAWFDELWNEDKSLVEDVKDEVLKYLAKLYVHNSPEFIYYKTLYHLFEKFLGEQADKGLLTEKTGFFDTEIWNMLYSFQKDGVKGAINKLERHNGCIIADSVGLGKTFEALAIIQYYERLQYRVLVLCPKKLKDNWTVYQSMAANKLSPFTRDRYSYTVMYHTDLGRARGTSDANSIDLANFNWGAWDLVVIDESHNLRGNPREKIDENDELSYNRAGFLLHKVIKEGVKTKVLMLSATPVNTNLKDLRNQIHYITEGRDDAFYESLGIESVSYTMKQAQSQFTNWVKSNKAGQKKSSQLFSALDSSLFKLLDELTIARSRKHIVSYYKDIDKKSFPKRLTPISVSTNIDLEGDFCSYDKVNEDIQAYKLSLFKPSSFVLEEFKELYEPTEKVKEFSQAQREDFLVEMMKINFLKRLESSVHSYTLTLGRALEKINSLQDKIAKFESGQTQDGDIYSFGDEDAVSPEEQDNSDDFTVGKKLKFELKHLDLEKWKEALSKDKDQLISLYNTASLVTPDKDAKLEELKQIITNKLKHPVNKDNKKILIFTAFADTADYLYEQLKDFIHKELGLNVALVTGSSHNKTTIKLPKGFQNDFNAILTCFAPFAKQRHKMPILPQDEEIDIIIATDCISEGQNLQDCDYVVNYDIHWNPVRIIQRFGRIDRINSPNAKIQMLNFWPTKDLDKYISLKLRVEARMALVDITATGEDNPFAEEEFNELLSNEIKFRAKQLKRLKEEVIDIEDMEDGISLTDFTLDDFRVDLLNYIKANEKELREAPLGLYTVVPSPDHELWDHSVKVSQEHREIIRPGVIFCLRHNESGREYEKLNPLHPYFMIYIRTDGTVRFRFFNAKQILDMYRILASGRRSPIESLCDQFDQETKSGEDMRAYNELIQKALKSIKASLAKKKQDQLQTHGDAVLPPLKQHDPGGEFELITWLIIK